MTSAASSDDAKLAVVTTGLRTNIADCSNAPNCTLLHRKVCSAIPHTCGECKDDYIGALGPSNSICASAELFLDSWTSSAANDDDYYNDDDDYDYNDANASATRRLWSFHQSREHNFTTTAHDKTLISVGLPTINSIVAQRSSLRSYSHTPRTMLDASDTPAICITDADCVSLGPWYTCSSTSVCDIAMAPCSNECSGRGYCGYFDRRNGASLLECRVGEPTCKAECVCDDGYYGPLCELDAEQLYDRMSIRLQLLQGIEYLIENDELSAENVVNWLQMLHMATAAPKELSPASVELVANMTDALVAAGAAMSVDYVSLLPLLDTLNDICALRDQKNTPYSGRTQTPTSQPTGFRRRALVSPNMGSKRSLLELSDVEADLTAVTMNTKVHAQEVALEVANIILENLAPDEDGGFQCW